MKLAIKDMFAGHDSSGTVSVVCIGVRQENGKMEILEWLHPKNSAVAEAIAHAINFTADKARS